MTAFASLLTICSILCFGLGYSTANRRNDRLSDIKKKTREEAFNDVVRCRRYR